MPWFKINLSINEEDEGKYIKHQNSNSKGNSKDTAVKQYQMKIPIEKHDSLYINKPAYLN